jgi:hypothetical protein
LTVARIVVLDSWPLGLASGRPGRVERDRCRAWVDKLRWAGVLVFAPEIADFEVRRELLRVGTTAGIRRLDLLERDLYFAPINTPAMRLAASFWAQVRRAGLPTASDLSLDADCIVAGQAAAVCGLGDVMTIATRNPSHLTRFPGIDAREWENIAP